MNRFEFHDVLCIACGVNRWQCACGRPAIHDRESGWFLRSMTVCPKCWRPQPRPKERDESREPDDMLEHGGIVGFRLGKFSRD